MVNLKLKFDNSKSMRECEKTLSIKLSNRLNTYNCTVGRNYGLILIPPATYIICQFLYIRHSLKHRHSSCIISCFTTNHFLYSSSGRRKRANDIIQLQSLLLALASRVYLITPAHSHLSSSRTTLHDLAFDPSCATPTPFEGWEPKLNSAQNLLGRCERHMLSLAAIHPECEQRGRLQESLIRTRPK